MQLLFYRHDGSEERSLQYTGPGRSFFAQNTQHVADFAAREGESVLFHVGHGVARTYRVEAIDSDTALLQHQPLR